MKACVVCCGQTEIKFETVSSAAFTPLTWHVRKERGEVERNRQTVLINLRRTGNFIVVVQWHVSTVH